MESPPHVSTKTHAQQRFLIGLYVVERYKEATQMFVCITTHSIKKAQYFGKMMRRVCPVILPKNDL